MEQVHLSRAAPIGVAREHGRRAFGVGHICHALSFVEDGVNLRGLRGLRGKSGRHEQDHVPQSGDDR